MSGLRTLDWLQTLAPWRQVGHAQAFHRSLCLPLLPSLDSATCVSSCPHNRCTSLSQVHVTTLRSSRANAQSSSHPESSDSFAGGVHWATGSCRGRRSTPATFAPIWLAAGDSVRRASPLRNAVVRSRSLEALACAAKEAWLRSASGIGHQSAEQSPEHQENTQDDTEEGVFVSLVRRDTGCDLRAARGV
ncbi:hypothetical protein PYCCODRAFT_405843 [Trametes coccinea BRFM310]|uniref:Uncharacterized protein n=1 Tax=Trametes coccinea (strain BRFM310) TaxID=1353009 RepID=A0A1Y2IPC9_TRAC3|nr:hypothetical protein PYCCODRAFT_405843 [Trametes coccinea BRFM310]